MRLPPLLPTLLFTVALLTLTLPCGALPTPAGGRNVEEFIGFPPWSEGIGLLHTQSYNHPSRPSTELPDYFYNPGHLGYSPVRGVIEEESSPPPTPQYPYPAYVAPQQSPPQRPQYAGYFPIPSAAPPSPPRSSRSLFQFFTRSSGSSSKRRSKLRG
ncbi:hypothetical protein [Sporisorium scitamineum]|uniref:Uncharacterized protein n=1 Tax=Sporisorium scitamineum TaxID=49012 RepID=A0A0F7RUV1_9BASI|nr:hypothetical protein [Sporisorium scitamineum]